MKTREVVTCHTAQSTGKAAIITNTHVDVLIFLPVFQCKIVRPGIVHFGISCSVTRRETYCTILACTVAEASLKTVVFIMRKCGTPRHEIPLVCIEPVGTVVIARYHHRSTLVCKCCFAFQRSIYGIQCSV